MVPERGWDREEGSTRVSQTTQGKSRTHVFIPQKSIYANVERISLGHASRGKFTWYTHWISGNVCWLPEKAKWVMVAMFYFYNRVTVFRSYLSVAGIKHHTQGNLKKVLFFLWFLRFGSIVGECGCSSNGEGMSWTTKRGELGLAPLFKLSKPNLPVMYFLQSHTF